MPRWSWGLLQTFDPSSAWVSSPPPTIPKAPLGGPSGKQRRRASLCHVGMTSVFITMHFLQWLNLSMQTMGWGKRVGCGQLGGLGMVAQECAGCPGGSRAQLPHPVARLEPHL